MRKGSKKSVPRIPQPYDYELSPDGTVKMVDGSKNYYSGQDLTLEAKRILEKHGFSLKDLFGTKWGRTDKELQTYEQKYTATNLYRYFGKGKSAVNISNDALFDMIIYMKKLGEQIQDKSEHYAYLNSVHGLEDKVKLYCQENGYFEAMLNDAISKMDKNQMEEFFKALPAIKFDEQAWRFWLCYTALNWNGRAEVIRRLTMCTRPAFDSIEILCTIYSLESKSNIGMNNKVNESFEKYGSNMRRLKQRLFGIAKFYVEQYGSKHSHYRRVWELANYGVKINASDWSLLFTYSHLITDWGKFAEVEEFVINAMGQKEKYLHKDCPENLAAHFQKQYQEIIEERKEAEFEQFLQYKEEIE